MHSFTKIYTKRALAYVFIWIVLFLVPAYAATNIRVELAHTPKVEVSCPDEFNVNLPNGQPVFLGRFATFRSEPGGISLNGRLFQTTEFSIHPNGPFLLNKRHYRGSLRLFKEIGTLQAVNVLDLEKYLASVVGSEMSSKWPLEALKAQAVVARTYALDKMNEHKKLNFDVLGSYQDQAYEGIEGESPSTEEAVASTQGQVLTYHGEIITAYYHADCGGRTEKGENVFPGELPYLQSVRCPYGEGSPYAHWTKTYTFAELSERLGLPIQNLSITKDPTTGRVSTVLLSTPTGPNALTGHELRKLLGTRDLRSTNFDATRIDKTVQVPREETLPPQYITEYIEKEIMKAKHESATLPVSVTPHIYLMHHAGALLETDVSNLNPLVTIADGGFLFTVSHDLLARTIKTEMVPETITVPHVTEGPVRKKTVWVRMQVPVEVTFTGKGWGHGVGLCQWGARGMGQDGKTYQDILHYYYQDVELTKIYD